MALDAGSGLGYGIVITFLTAIAGFLFYWGLNIKWKPIRDIEGKVISVNDLKWLKPLCLGLSYLVFLMAVSITNDMAITHLAESSPGAMLTRIYIFLLLLLVPIVFCVPVFVIVAIVQNINIKRALKRGLPP